jgi:cytochrome c biogenesis protein CcmG, thiol:disulfide interchange protein DsbE
VSRNSVAKPILAAIALLATIVLAACGDEGGGNGDYGGPAPDYASALADAPPRLAALYEQANELLPGGVDAFRAELDSLRGHPVVVNKWASWCGPCRAEFPHFQAVSAELGDRVAFLGVDSEDSADAAATFLGEYPVPYPSFSDPDGEIAAEIEATLGFPATVFYDRDGKLVHVRQGPYTSEEELRAEVRRYALGQGS